MKKSNICRKLIPATLMMTLLLTGCGEAQSADSEGFTPLLDTEKEVTIKVVGGYDNFPSLEQVALDFNEYYPNVVIDYSKVDDYSNMYETLLTDNPDVDIFMANNTAVKNSEVVKSVAVDIADEELDFDLTALDEGVLESAKSGDSLLRLPLYSVCDGLIVNMDLLAENGLTLPQNYEEFINCCEVLKAAGYTPIYGYDGSDKMSHGLYGAMVLTMAAKNNTDGSISEALNNEEEGACQVYLEGLERVEAFRQLGYYSKESNADIEDSYEGAILRFFEGDVPFLSATTETMSGTKKRESKSESFSANPFEYTFIASPMGEDGSYIYVNSSDGLAINKNGANLEYATEFMRFFCSVEELNASADAKGMLSTSTEAQAAESFPNLDFDNEDYVAYISDFYLENYPSKTFNKILQMVSDDGVSASEALDQYDEILNGFKEE